VAKKYEIENRTRSTFVFEAFREGPKDASGKARRVADHDNDVVIGDMANTPELMASRNAVYSRKVPPPVVVVDEAWLKGLLPAQRAFYDGLVRKNDLRVREIAG
jgi:hypothetical protein